MKQPSLSGTFAPVELPQKASNPPVKQFPVVTPRQSSNTMLSTNQPNLEVEKLTTQLSQLQQRYDDALAMLSRYMRLYGPLPAE